MICEENTYEKNETNNVISSSNTSGRTGKKKVLYDSLTIHFSVWVFIEQFLNHMLFPLFLPWMVYRHGWLSLAAQQFICPTFCSKNTFGIVWNWLTPGIFYTMVVLHFGQCSDLQMSLLFPVLLYSMHRAMVALKYATLSPSEYRRLLRGSNISWDRVNYAWPSVRKMKIATIYQFQSMIMSGYIYITSSMINLEVVVAGARAGIPLRDIYFEIPNPNLGNKERLQILRWQVFLSKALQIPLNEPSAIHAENSMNKILVRQKDGSYRVCIHNVCVAIFHATCQCGSRIGYHIIMVLSVLNAAIPGYMADNPSNTIEIVYFSCILFMNFSYYMVMLTILHAAVREMHRKSCLSDIMQCMIRLHDYNLKANVRFGSGGPATDERMITSEIKTIQDMITENTDMIRLSSYGENGRMSEDRRAALRSSLISNANSEKQSNSVFSVDKSDDCDVDIEDPHFTDDGDDSNVRYSFTGISSSITSEGSVEVPGSTIADFHFPQIAVLQYSNNFTTWMQCRQILQNFGYRFSVRLNALIVVILIILLSQSLWLIAYALTTERDNFLSNAAVLQTILWITVYACTLAYIIFVAHVTNIKNIAHRETVSSHMLNMKQQLWRTPDTDRDAQAKLKAGIDAAYSVTHAISIMNEVHPIRIFGIVANARTSAVIMYALAVFLYALFQYAKSGNILVPT